MPPSMQSKPGSGVLADNVVGMLAYLTIVPTIIFLLIEPYRRNRWVRFHAWQCIDLALTWCSAELLLGALTVFAPAAAIPLGVLDSLFTLALFALWIMLMVKTINGQRYRLPLLGALAERQSALKG